jgi:DNA-binding beta-propeller fold protein YncE
VRNLGTDMLTVAGIASDSSSFSAAPAGFTLAPRESRQVTVTFAPLSAGVIEGTLSLNSDDPDEGLLTVALLGEGLVPPDIAVSPTLLAQDLFTGERATQALVIENTGATDLTLTVGVGDSPPAGAIQPASDGPRVLVLSTGAVSLSIERALDLLGVPFAGLATETFTGIDFSPYETVIAAMNGGFISSESVQALANAAAGGRRLVLFGGSNYGPYYDGVRNYLLGHTGQTGWVISRTPHQTVIEPGDPLAAGLPATTIFNNVTAAYYMLRISDPAATVVALNGDNHPALVHKPIGDGHLVYVVNATVNEFWTDPADFAILEQVVDNAFQFSDIRWLSVSPEAATVPPGGRVEVTVGFDAAGLIGGDYAASLAVESNDPDEPEVLVPVSLHVTGAPDIEVSREALDFGSLFIGAARVESVVVSNEGTDVLVVSEVRSDSGAFSAEPATLRLEVGESREVAVTFRPAEPGPVEGTLTLASNDPDEGEMRLALRGVGLVPPDVTVAPSALSESLFAGDAVTRALTVGNGGGSDLIWEARAEFADGRGSSLEDALAHLNEGFTQVTAVIPNRYDFAEGESGSSIEDGGADMYDGGNILRTNLGGPIQYSNNVIASSGVFGSGGRYFTRKYPGLFVLVADLAGVDAFRVEGNLGADGFGNVDGAVLEAPWRGVNYRGFVKRVFNAGDPSVNHLVILADNPEATHRFSSNTNDDFHEVQGLLGSDRIYYLLYARQAGGYIDDATTLGIMRAFLNVLNPGPRWLTVAPASGTVPAGGAVDLGVTVDTAGLLGGDYGAGLVVASNDPDEPEVVVPVSLHVTGAPDIEVSRESVDFGSLFVGAARVESVVVSNEGTDVLLVSEVGSDSEAFSAEPATFSLEVAESQTVAVTFRPSVPGPVEGTLTLASNDPNESHVAIRLNGTGLDPPVVGVEPPSLAATVPLGQERSRTLTVRNGGLGSLEFSLKVGGRLVEGGPSCDPTRALVAEFATGTLASVDLASGAMTRIVSGLGTPTGIVLNRAENVAYVAEGPSGRLARVSLPGGSIVRVATGLASPFGVALDPTETVAYVTERASGELSSVNLTTGTVSTIASGLVAPTDMSLDRTGAVAYVLEYGSGELSRIHISTGVVEIVASGLDGPVGLAIHPSGESAYVTEANAGRVSSIDLASGARTTVIPSIGGTLSDIVLDPDGERAHFTTSTGFLLSVQFSPFLVRTVASSLFGPTGVALDRPAGCAGEFLTLSPSSGTVPPLGFMEVTAIFRAGSLAPGTYGADIDLLSNDPVTPQIVVPAT